MGDVDFKVFVRVSFAGIAIRVEWFPLGRERGGGVWAGEGGHVGWGWVVDHSRKSGGDVVRRNVGCGKILWVVGWDMCGMEGGGYVVGDVGGR